MKILKYWPLAVMAVTIPVGTLLACKQLGFSPLASAYISWGVCIAAGLFVGWLDSREKR